MRLTALLVVLAAAVAAGCLGLPDPSGQADAPASESPDAAPARGSDVAASGPGPAAADDAAQTEEDWPRCEHPWPCGDGAEWPRELTDEAQEHPRQPPVLPEDLGIQDGTVADRGDEAVTYRWTTPVGPAAPVPSGVETGRTSFDAPAGLYLRVGATMDWRGEDPTPPRGEVGLDLRVLTEEGKVVCRTEAEWVLSSEGYDGADGPVSCKSAVLEPRDDRRNWTVEVENQYNVDAAERVRVDVTLEVAEPQAFFELASLEEVDVASFDGTQLHGWILRPDVPDGVEVPTILASSPYADQTAPAPDDPGSEAYGEEIYGVNPRTLVENGYAVAIFNVRGTGDSGGCFEMWGPGEQRDQAVLVDWLAERSWSNGRVGMSGLSYLGTTPWEAATQAPKALKTIAVAGMVSDAYTFYHTPQGAALTIGAGFQTAFDALVTGPPAAHTTFGESPSETAAQAPAYAQDAPGRACPEVAETVVHPWQGTVSDDRNRSFWEERDLAERFGDVTASVLLTHGFQDLWGSGHQLQESRAWSALPGDIPRTQLEGQWGHEFPPDENLEALDGTESWTDRYLEWMDFWLKGVGEPPAELGSVQYEDDDGRWHTSGAWPPEEATQETLYLAGDRLKATPEGTSESFRSVPDAAAAQQGNRGAGGNPGPVCGNATASPDELLRFTSRPLREETVVAGNPAAHLRLATSQPGGLVTVSLLDLGPDFRCDEQGVPRNATTIAKGVADLRFHDGGYQGKDAPVGETLDVRVDLTNPAHVVEPGHRLAVVLSHGDPVLREGQPYTPQVTVDGDSRLVLPVVEGSTGGPEAGGALPPAPMLPGS